MPEDAELEPAMCLARGCDRAPTCHRHPDSGRPPDPNPRRWRDFSAGTRWWEADHCVAFVALPRRRRGAAETTG